ncbi:hypothetical protein GCM10027276_07260 [Comamonas piscis]
MAESRPRIKTRRREMVEDIRVSGTQAGGLRSLMGFGVGKGLRVRNARVQAPGPDAAGASR